MITLTRLNRQPLALNCDLIETIEKTPDTVISVTTGNKYVVLETQEEIIDKIIKFKQAIYIGKKEG